MSIQPRYTAYELKGKASMQTLGGSGPVGNPSVNLQGFGLGKRDDDWGGRIHVGDDFSGLELDYQKIDMESYDRGVLTSDFGVLQSGDFVRTRFKMDEWRLAYYGKILSYPLREDLTFDLALGGVLAHRRMTFNAFEANGARTQKLKISDDGMPYIAARGRLTFRDVSFRADYAINPDLGFGGDFYGTLEDLELTASYLFEDQDLRVFAGWRRSHLSARGNEGPLGFDTDFKLDGFFFGIAFQF